MIQYKIISSSSSSGGITNVLTGDSSSWALFAAITSGKLDAGQILECLQIAAEKLTDDFLAKALDTNILLQGSFALLLKNPSLPALFYTHFLRTLFLKTGH